MREVSHKWTYGVVMMKERYADMEGQSFVVISRVRSQRTILVSLLRLPITLNRRQQYGSNPRPAAQTPSPTP